MEWEEEKIRAEASRPDPDAPPGMVLMPEEERLETLSVLMKTQESTQRELSKMPLTVETPGLRSRKSALEAKLKELEEAVTIFSARLAPCRN